MLKFLAAASIAAVVGTSSAGYWEHRAGNVYYCQGVSTYAVCYRLQTKWQVWIDSKSINILRGNIPVFSCDVRKPQRYCQDFRR